MLAILEALETLEEQAYFQPPDQEHEKDSDFSSAGQRPRVTGRELACRLQLHPTTVYRHVKQLRAWGMIE